MTHHNLIIAFSKSSMKEIMNAVTECELGYLRRFSVLGTDVLLVSESRFWISISRGLHVVEISF